MTCDPDKDGTAIDCTLLVDPPEDGDDAADDDFDFSLPEDVVILLESSLLEPTDPPEWDQYDIAQHDVVWRDGPSGAASYESCYSCMLDHTLKGALREFPCPGEGWFVAEGVTGEWFDGDTYYQDDPDLELTCKGLRPARPDEIPVTYLKTPDGGLG